MRDLCRNMEITARVALLRRTVASMLQNAQDALPAGCRLRVHTAFRTLETQQNGYSGYMAKLREQHPEWPMSTLRRESNKFWHPPDQKAPPGHCTGGAVDVGLVSLDGTELNLREAMLEGLNTNPTYSRWTTERARENRRILIEAMSSAGFSNCADEWWHWSYGDSGWAARRGKDHAIYGLVVPPPDVLAAATLPEDPPKEEPQD
jgi:D-alanyl-D-alanine dipeptidase